MAQERLDDRGRGRSGVDRDRGPRRERGERLTDSFWSHAMVQTLRRRSSASSQGAHPRRRQGRHGPELRPVRASRPSSRERVHRAQIDGGPPGHTPRQNEAQGPRPGSASSPTSPSRPSRPRCACGKGKGSPEYWAARVKPGVPNHVRDRRRPRGHRPARRCAWSPRSSRSARASFSSSPIEENEDEVETSVCPT